MDAEQPGRVRHSNSLIDFIKIRVLLPTKDGGSHPHVLSRFLLARTLTACSSTLSAEVAVKVALEVKKALVDSLVEGREAWDGAGGGAGAAEAAATAPGAADAGAVPAAAEPGLEVTQAVLEATLFAALARRNFGAEYVSRYRALTAFHATRTPLLLLLGGPPLSGVSSVASRLAARLNLPTVVQTCWAARLLPGARPDGPAGLPAWAFDATGGRAASDAASFRADAAAVASALSCDLRRCLGDGRALVVEGLHCHAPLFRALLDRLAQPGDRRPIVVPIHVLLAGEDRQARANAAAPTDGTTGCGAAD